MTITTDGVGAATQTVRVGLVDDHESIRMALRTACINAGYSFVEAGESVPDFLTRVADQPCDVVVLDLSLGDGRPISENVADVAALGASVLVHSIADRAVMVREALAAGAAGVIPKSASSSTLMAAIKLVAGGQVLNNLEWASALNGDEEFVKTRLERRDRDLLQRFASGMPLKMVADQAGIPLPEAREMLERIRALYVRGGRAAPTKVDQLRQAVEDSMPGVERGRDVG